MVTKRSNHNKRKGRQSLLKLMKTIVTKEKGNNHKKEETILIKEKGVNCIKKKRETIVTKGKGDKLNKR